MDAVAAEPLVKGRRKVKAFSDLGDRHQRRRMGEYRSAIFTTMSANGLSVFDQGAILLRLGDERLDKRLSRSPKELRFYELIQSYKEAVTKKNTEEQVRILSVFRSFKIFTREMLNKEYFSVEDEVSAHSWSKAGK